MPTFIEKCRCRGNRPAGIAGLHHNLRSDITGTLLRDRRVPRFLVAPKGYGKSSCAFEYAQVVFGFAGVFWIRCESPCFIRDLDDGTLASQVLRADPNARLVVLDDVPHLDQARTEALDEFVCAMLDQGCEVVVSCAPSLDTVSARHLDKIVVDAAGLLLSDDEVEVERMRGTLSKGEAEALAPARRAASLVWGDGSTDQIVRGIPEEELPAELELAIFCMLALVEGSIDDLASIVAGARLAEDAEYLASMFPYLGIDMDAGTFSAIEAPVADLVSQAKMSAAALSRSSLQGDREGLCFALADKLLAKGEGQRAAELLAACAAKASVAKWLVRHGWDMTVSCMPLAIVELYDASGAGTDGACEPLAMRAWACAMLDDAEGARRARARVSRSSGACWSAVAASCLSRNVPAPAPPSDEDMLAEVQTATHVMQASARTDVPLGDGSGPIDWACLLELELARLADAGSYPERFSAFCDGERSSEAPRRNAALLAGAWFVEAQAARGAPLSDDPTDGNASAGACRVASCLARILAEGGHGTGMTWPESVAVNALQTAAETWPYQLECSVAPASVAAARKVAVSLLVQADAYRKDRHVKEQATGEYQLTHEDSFRPNPQPASKVAALRVTTPTLVLSLFGGLEAWVGADRSEPRQIRRRNAKVALALLVANRGREITKERLSAMMWPDVDPAAGRQNLYVIWAYLKKAFKVGESCPYLVSTQTGYKLDARYVASDVEEFEDLCRSLMFGREDKDTWEELYGKVSSDFSEDLLPEVVGNAHVDSMRDRYRTQLVDGLVEASSRMAQEGENRGSMWFAREALRRDRSREDAYIALMEAQIASNQRGAALDTYFECRRFLSDQLGIDPSKRVVELYRSVIEAVEEF